ncbi:DNA alkylation repair protein [soil metagenome]
MNFEETMSRLSSLGSEKGREINARNGAGENQFGVKMGDIRALAKEIKLNPELAPELWASENFDARMLATLLMKPNQLSVQEVEALLFSARSTQLVDWLGTNVIKPRRDKESVREIWMNSSDEMTARMGWSLTAERIIKEPVGLDLPGLLDQIEAEMGSAPKASQWTMNYCLAEIGIHFAEHRARAIAIAEKIGAFKDWPTSKGCTSPYAPIWIAAMVGRA